MLSVIMIPTAIKYVDEREMIIPDTLCIVEEEYPTDTAPSDVGAFY